MQFTIRQSTAIGYPCLSGDDVAHGRYSEHKGKWLSVLTVNK